MIIYFLIKILDLITKRIKTKKGYNYVIYPNKDDVFEINEEVAVFQKSKFFSKGRVQKIGNKIKILYKDNSSYEVNPYKIIKQYQKNNIIITYDTAHYRRIAKSQPKKTDFCVEIGSDFVRITLKNKGETTFILSKYCKKVLGIDKCLEHIEFSKKKYSDLNFETLDIFVQENEEKLKNLCLNCDIIFLDINGNRPLEGVMNALDLIKRLISPSLIVVKSKELYKKYENN
jgi:precorrin-6B methylase 2